MSLTDTETSTTIYRLLLSNRTRTNTLQLKTKQQQHIQNRVLLMSSNQGIFLSRNQVAGHLNIYLIVRSSALDIFLSVVFQNEN